MELIRGANVLEQRRIEFFRVRKVLLCYKCEKRELDLIIICSITCTPLPVLSYAVRLTNVLTLGFKVEALSFSLLHLIMLIQADTCFDFTRSIRTNCHQGISSACVNSYDKNSQITKKLKKWK